jgi:hypothetical protein
MNMKYIISYNESVTKSDFLNFLNDFGFFITLNLSKIGSFAIDKTAENELATMQKTLRSPIINGKNYVEITSDFNSIIKNPALASGLLTQIKSLIEYIEPRIIKFVKNSEQKKGWLERIYKLKEEYKKIIL